jgi:hypothetical protein
VCKTAVIDIDNTLRRFSDAIADHVVHAEASVTMAVVIERVRYDQAP